MQRSLRQIALTWTCNSWAIYTLSHTHTCLGMLCMFLWGFVRADEYVNINGNLHVSALFTKTLRGAVQQILIQLK